MAKRWKRAFTITELVIVIAVVAILAAVLIPTFANVIKKADESADTQTVKNLNTILSSEETVSREKPLSMAEVVEQAASGGYLVTALTPTSEGYDILWDQTSNRFVLADASGKIVYKDNATTVSHTDEGFWKIYNSENEINKDKSSGSNKYSIYLAEDFSFSAERTLDVTVGVDVGNNADVSVNYADTVAETAVFRTDGGELTIDNSLGSSPDDERTLVIIKPDNWRHPSSRPGNIIDMLSRTGLRIVGCKVHRMSVNDALEFYGPVQGAPADGSNQRGNDVGTSGRAEGGNPCRADHGRAEHAAAGGSARARPANGRRGMGGPSVG